MGIMIGSGNRDSLIEQLTRRRYTVGVDLGQTVDPTAICVLERADIPALEIGQVLDPNAVPYKITRQVRHLERLPLQTPYPKQVWHIGRMLATAPLSSGASLVIDHTGVGKPVFDIFTKASMKPIGITITAGDKWSGSGREFRVPKLLLVSRLQRDFHEGNLKIAKSLPEAQVLANELQDFKVSYSPNTGHARFGAREGRHDDLVLALAIACWFDDHRSRNAITVSEFAI